MSNMKNLLLDMAAAACKARDPGRWSTDCDMRRAARDVALARGVPYRDAEEYAAAALSYWMPRD